METHGHTKGEYLFHADLEKTSSYLADQEKVMAFNPFCEKVETTEIDNIFRWHFQVADPRNNPFQVIFFVEQHDELLVSLPDNYPYKDGMSLPDDIIREHTVGKTIRWTPYTVNHDVRDPDNYVFEGKVNAEMSLYEHRENQTQVNFTMDVDITFELYPIFRIFPEKIITSMTNAGMSLIMQMSTNQMFQSILSDFKNIHR